MIDGVIKYNNFQVDISNERIDGDLRNLFKDIVNTISSQHEPSKVPSFWECKWCDIPKIYCEEKIYIKNDIITEHELF